MSDNTSSNLVSVGSLYREFLKTRESQAELLARHHIKPVFTTPSGKGFAHLITQPDAQLLRGRMQEEADLHASEKAKKATAKKIKPTEFAEEDELTDDDVRTYMIISVTQMIEVSNRLAEQVFEVSERSKVFAQLVATQENMFVQMRSLYVEIAAISELLKNRSFQAP